MFQHLLEELFVEKALDVCKKTLRFKFRPRRPRRISAYYSSSKLEEVHLRLLYVFQMDFVISMRFSAYYKASKWSGATFELIFTVLFARSSKITLVFLAKLSRPQICAYYSRFS